MGFGIAMAGQLERLNTYGDLVHECEESIELAVWKLKDATQAMNNCHHESDRALAQERVEYYHNMVEQTKEHLRRCAEEF